MDNNLTSKELFLISISNLHFRRLYDKLIVILQKYFTIENTKDDILLQNPNINIKYTLIYHLYNNDYKEKESMLGVFVELLNNDNNYYNKYISPFLNDNEYDYLYIKKDVLPHCKFFNYGKGYCCFGNKCHFYHISGSIISDKNKIESPYENLCDLIKDYFPNGEYPFPPEDVKFYNNLVFNGMSVYDIVWNKKYYI
jgi:hypothetical protein